MKKAFNLKTQKTLPSNKLLDPFEKDLFKLITNKHNKIEPSKYNKLIQNKLNDTYKNDWYYTMSQIIKDTAKFS